MSEGTGLFVGPDGDEDLYELVMIVGGGGQGQVWKVQMRPDLDSHAVVHYAIKVIEAADDDEPEVDWIRRAKSLWNLDNPGLVRMFEPFVGVPMHYAGAAAGKSGERVRYLVMELVDGVPLNEWLEDNPAATLSQRIGSLRMIAAALDMMHKPSAASGRLPVAHGDVKPSNILVQPSGASKLVDFGLARVVGARGVPGVGSLPFLAPELLSSADGLPTPDSDRFSFAATLFTVADGGAAAPQRRRRPGPGPDPDHPGRVAAGHAGGPAGAGHGGPRRAGSTAARPRHLAGGVPHPDDDRTGVVRQGRDVAARCHPGVGRRAAGAAGPVPAHVPERRAWRRVLLVAVVVLALLGGGTALALSRTEPAAPDVAAPERAAAGAGAAGATTTPTTAPAGTMPNVVGTSVDSATADLAVAGLPTPTVLEEIDTQASDGQILSQTPAAGTVRPGSIALVVARAPVVTYLADLHSVDDDPDTGTAAGRGSHLPPFDRRLDLHL